MYLLDSDLFSNYRRERPRATPLVQKVESERQAGQVRLSILTVQETLHGATGVVNTFRSQKKPEKFAEALRFLEMALAEISAFPVLGYDAASFHELERLTDAFKQPMKPDLCIAAQALAHGLTVVTRNTRDFARVPGLKIETWPEPCPPRDASVRRERARR